MWLNRPQLQHLPLRTAPFLGDAEDTNSESEFKWEDAKIYVVRGAWCVVRGAWCVVRGAWCVVRGYALRTKQEH